MSQAPARILLAAALGCALLALDAACDCARADPSPQAIRSDAHRYAVDIHREAREVGHQVRHDAQQLHRQLALAGDHLSLQWHHLGHRIRHWWSRPRTS